MASHYLLLRPWPPGPNLRLRENSTATPIIFPTPSLSHILRQRCRKPASIMAKRKTEQETGIRIPEERKGSREGAKEEKVVSLIELTGKVTRALPGPRIGQTPFPWILAVPLAYIGFSLVTVLVKAVWQFSPPKESSKKLVWDFFIFFIKQLWFEWWAMFNSVVVISAVDLVGPMIGEDVGEI